MQRCCCCCCCYRCSPHRPTAVNNDPLPLPLLTLSLLHVSPSLPLSLSLKSPTCFFFFLFLSLFLIVGRTLQEQLLLPSRHSFLNYATVKQTLSSSPLLTHPDLLHTAQYNTTHSSRLVSSLKAFISSDSFSPIIVDVASCLFFFFFKHECSSA